MPARHSAGSSSGGSISHGGGAELTIELVEIHLSRLISSFDLFLIFELPGQLLPRSTTHAGRISENDTQNLSEDEAISLMSVGVDFGITQVFDGNWGVHASIRKNTFAGVSS